MPETDGIVGGDLTYRHVLDDLRFTQASQALAAAFAATNTCY